MNDVSDTELLSAYLDGELTAEEQARAEHLLAVSAEARQLLEELRALSGTLQGLPQQKLDEDLSARVLQIAERRMLAPEVTEKPDGADKPSAGRAAASLTTPADDSSRGFPWREISWRGLFSPRALIWTAIIVIAAIIIHKNVPPENANREVVRVDKTETKSSAGKQAAAGEGKDKSSQPASVGPAVRVKDSGREESKKADEHFAGGAKAGESRLALTEKAGAEKPRHDQAEAPEGAQGQLAQEALPPGPAEELGDRSAMRKAPAGDGAVAAKGAGGFGGGMGASESQRRIDAMKAAPSAGSLAANGPAPAPAMAPAPSITPLAAPTAAPLPAPPAEQPAMPAGVAKSAEPAKRGESPATIVQLTCTPAAAQSGLFTELTARNGVAVRQLVGSPLSAQLNYAGVDNNGPVANGRPIPLTNSATGDSSNRQQAAPQAPGAGNLKQNEIVQNSSSGAAQQNLDDQTLNGQARAKYALRRGAESNASNLNAAKGVAPAGAPNQGNFYQQGPAQTADASNFAVQNAASGSAWYYYECDATDDQLHRLLKQLREHGDAFTLPEAAPSPDPAARVPRTPRDARNGTVAKQEPGYYRYEDQTASRGASQAPPAKGDAARQSRMDAEALAADNALDPTSQRRASERAKPAAAQPKAASQPAAATGKTQHVVFVLMVDRAAPPPAAAAPAPAAGK